MKRVRERKRVDVARSDGRRRCGAGIDSAGKLRGKEALVARMPRVAGVLEVVLRRRLLAREERQREEEDDEKAAERHQKRELTPATNEYFAVSWTPFTAWYSGSCAKA